MASGRKEWTFLWYIEKYSYCGNKNGDWLRSPTFTVDGLGGSTWKLLLYPRGERVQHKGFVSLKLYRSDDGPEYVPIKFELSVLSEDGSILSTKEYDHSFTRWSSVGDYEFLKVDKLLYCRNFPQDILTVRCKMWGGEGDVDSIAPIHARTRIRVQKVCFRHEVENFSLLQPKQMDTVEIPSPLATRREVLASSSLYFTLDSGRDGDMIVEISPSHWRFYVCKLKISLLDALGNEILCADDDNRFDMDRKNFRNLTLTRRNILNYKSRYLLNDRLSLKCECSYSIDTELEEILRTPYEMPRSAPKKINVQIYPSALEDMKALYMNKGFTDVEVKSKTKSFPAHKFILCARSPVFKRMMTSDMREKNSDCIRVDDLEDDVVHQFLLFLYSDTVEHLDWEMATRLYYAADRYEVGKLKAVCSSFLFEHITPTKAGDLLLLADTHSDTELKKVVENFILENDEQVFGSDEWEKLLESHHELAARTMHQRFKRQKMH